MQKMRNQPSKKTGKVDTIDRHTKGRLLIIDASMILSYACQDYMMLLVDVAEISDYYDVIVTCKKEEIDYIKEYCEHWALKVNVKERFTDYENLVKEYRIMVCFTTKKDRDEYKKYYRTDVLSR